MSLLEVALGSFEVELDANQQRHVAEGDRGVHLICQDISGRLHRLVVGGVDVLHLAMELESRRLVGLGSSRQHEACSRDVGCKLGVSFRNPPGKKKLEVCGKKLEF